LSVDLVFRALLSKLCINGDLNLNLKERMFLVRYEIKSLYFGVSDIIGSLLFRKLSVDNEVGIRLSEME